MKQKSTIVKIFFLAWVIILVVWVFWPHIRGGIVLAGRDKKVVYLTSDYSRPYLVDQEATAETRSLIQWLSASSEQYLLFGQQNGNVQSIKEKRGIASDVYHMIGTYPAVIGYDMSDIEHRTDYFVRKAQEAYSSNCIITLSDHMPEFNVEEIMP